MRSLSWPVKAALSPCSTSVPVSFAILNLHVACTVQSPGNVDSRTLMPKCSMALCHPLNYLCHMVYLFEQNRLTH
ncbi:hypothetical protein XELAEV_18001686mg [Xenopus laevis]|uniref:Uncharacterized protein n=1 Tax=Xenopus laevis TaxID=8355 RepID=A0A974BQ30_XENLA|nr:hypothetical protein XELAEV_18001686mg [Xenopus laevis]